LDKLNKELLKIELERFDLEIDDLKEYLIEKILYQSVISRRFSREIFINLKELEVYYEKRYLPFQKEKNQKPQQMIKILSEIESMVKKEKAELARVATLLEAVEGKSNEEKVKHLVENNVSEILIIEMAKIDQGVIDGVKQAMETELKEQQRLAEEEAARKKEEAAGPSLDKIPPDKMLEYIESIREIMEFSDEEKEIRVMCDQSAIPKSLVDIAVSEPDKLDELEKEAEG